MPALRSADHGGGAGGHGACGVYVYGVWAYDAHGHGAHAAPVWVHDCGVVLPAQLPEEEPTWQE